ncbi:unnamed protein product [Caenorhabditis nigoni]
MLHVDKVDSFLTEKLNISASQLTPFVNYKFELRLLSESEELLDEVNIKKRWLHPSVTEIEVKQDGIWGVIYKPPGPGPFSCIIATPILTGKLSKAHAPLFAAEGFLSFCFPMFDEPGLPKRMQDVEIEYLSVCSIA